MSLTPQTAVVLAGGPSSSKRFLGVSLKPLLPVANRPLVEYVAAVFLAAGVEHLLISVDGSAVEVANQLEEHFRRSPLQVECIVQKTVPGTGGSLKELEERLRDNAFWVASGDLFLNADLRQMLAFHQERSTVATVGAMHFRPLPWELEQVEVDTNRDVKAIHRLHPMQNKRSVFRPAGLYLFEPEVLDLIPTDSYFDLQEQLFLLLAERKTPAAVWHIKGYCRRIFSAADYLLANREVLLKQGAETGEEFPHLPEAFGHYRPEISPTAVLLDPLVIGSATRVGEGVILMGPTAIGDQCEIESDAVLNECVVMPRARIGRGARLDHCILGEGAQVEDGAVLRDTVVLKQSTKILDMAIPSSSQAPLSLSELTTPPLPIRQTKTRRLYLLGKRVFDVGMAALALTVLSPVMLLIALAIKLDSPGTIIFRQSRCGRGGRPFSMYKFRSMVVNAEDLRQKLAASNEVDGPMFKLTIDPRVTRVGWFLRATNLDEVPQLWNVVRGDMSLVGPRPLSMDEMRYNPLWRDLRLSVRPGLTGLWQVEGYTKTSFADWIKYDIYYVRNMSPWLDLKIMSKTLLRRFGSGNGQEFQRQARHHV
jgi:lipopolysaccharide/colanic/teichoic acid biosynthesis glycosyltransferase/NDP-sugar pyrophosphorylase family protein